jgi:hypothetical protein
LTDAVSSIEPIIVRRKSGPSRQPLPGQACQQQAGDDVHQDGELAAGHVGADVRRGELEVLQRLHLRVFALPITLAAPVPIVLEHHGTGGENALQKRTGLLDVDVSPAVPGNLQGQPLFDGALAGRGLLLSQLHPQVRQ